MFWIKTVAGNIANIARATDIQVVDPEITGDGTYEVRAYFPVVSHKGQHDYSILFEGFETECRAYLDALVEALRSCSGGSGQSYHDVKVPEPPKPDDPEVPF
jgi:hypothetical protein